MRTYHQRDESKKPLIAGILMIIACILAIASAAQILLLDIDTLNIEDEIQGEEVQGLESIIQTIMNICGAVFLILGIVLLIGGILAIKRIHWGFALGASIAGVFSGGPLFLASLLSLIALVLIYMSKEEFEGKGDDVPPPSYSKQSPVQGVRSTKQEERFCPDCGTKMNYEYNRWYCPTCQEYK